MFSRLLTPSTVKAHCSHTLLRQFTRGLSRQAGCKVTSDVRLSQNVVSYRYFSSILPDSRSAQQKQQDSRRNDQRSQQDKSSEEKWNQTTGRKLLWGTTLASAASLFSMFHESDVDSTSKSSEFNVEAAIENAKESATQFGIWAKDVLRTVATYGLAAVTGATLLLLSDDALDTVAAKMDPIPVGDNSSASRTLLLDWLKSQASGSQTDMDIPEGSILLMNTPAGSFYYQPGTSSRQSRLWWGNKNVTTSRAIILATNIAVFLAWRVPRLSHHMMRHFTCSLNGVVNFNRFHTLVTAGFSHSGLLHLAFNMLAINSFLAYFDRWSDKAFWTFYLGANAAGMLGHLLVTAISVMVTHSPRSWRNFKYYTAHSAPALGASSAACGMFAFIALIDVHSRFNIMFIPFPIEGGTLLKVAILFDTIGAFMTATGRPFTTIAHGAHLLGYVSGYFAYQYVLYRRAQLRRLRLRQ